MTFLTGWISVPRVSVRNLTPYLVISLGSLGILAHLEPYIPFIFLLGSCFDLLSITL
jgi:hypothetical protein